MPWMVYWEASGSQTGFAKGTLLDSYGSRKQRQVFFFISSGGFLPIRAYATGHHRDQYHLLMPNGEKNLRQEFYDLLAFLGDLKFL